MFVLYKYKMRNKKKMTLINLLSNSHYNIDFHWLFITLSLTWANDRYLIEWYGYNIFS